MDPRIPNEGLWTYSQSLTTTHLEAALGAVAEAAALRDSKADPLRVIRTRHKVISAVIHAYSSLESALNLLGHQFFDDPESAEYIPREKRDVALELLARAWPRTLPVVDKLRFVLSRPGARLEARLEAQLRELSNLRNWLVHGFVYKTTLLLARSSPDGFDVLDRQDSVEWMRSFSNTKFRPIDQLEYQDAVTAVTIALDVLRQVAAATNQIFSALDYRGGRFRTVIIGRDTDVEALVDQYVREALPNESG
jgi:hypothetical protein